MVRFLPNLNKEHYLDPISLFKNLNIRAKNSKRSSKICIHFPQYFQSIVKQKMDGTRSGFLKSGPRSGLAKKTGSIRILNTALKYNCASYLSNIFSRFSLKLRISAQQQAQHSRLKYNCAAYLSNIFSRFSFELRISAQQQAQHSR